MVSCCVPDCNNYSGKTGKAVSYHKFPQDHRKKAWLDRIRRVNMPPLENCYVCSEHFLPSCFEIDLRSQLTGKKCRKYLKNDAIPSVFPFGPEAKRARLSSESCLQRQRHKEVSFMLLILLCTMQAKTGKIFAFYIRPLCCDLPVAKVKCAIQCTHAQALGSSETRLNKRL